MQSLLRFLMVLRYGTIIWYPKSDYMGALENNHEVRYRDLGFNVQRFA